MTMDKDSYLGSGSLLNQDITKYGKQYFTKSIIAIARDSWELNELEKQIIQKNNAVKSPMFYNMKAGGGVHSQSMMARYRMKWAYRHKRKLR